MISCLSAGSSSGERPVRHMSRVASSASSSSSRWVGESHSWGRSRLLWAYAGWWEEDLGWVKCLVCCVTLQLGGVQCLLTLGACCSLPGGGPGRQRTAERVLS
jgi:hypothetical protein